MSMIGAKLFTRIRIRRAKKLHCCMTCKKVIKIGELYRYQIGTYDFQFYQFKDCMPCVHKEGMHIHDAWSIKNSEVSHDAN